MPGSPPNEPARRLLSITPAEKSANSGVKKISGKYRSGSQAESARDDEDDDGGEMAAVEMARSASSGSQVRMHSCFSCSSCRFCRRNPFVVFRFDFILFTFLSVPGPLDLLYSLEIPRVCQVARVAIAQSRAAPTSDCSFSGRFIRFDCFNHSVFPRQRSNRRVHDCAEQHSDCGRASRRTNHICIHDSEHVARSLGFRRQGHHSAAERYLAAAAHSVRADGQ